MLTSRNLHQSHSGQSWLVSKSCHMIDENWVVVFGQLQYRIYKLQSYSLLWLEEVRKVSVVRCKRATIGRWRLHVMTIICLDDFTPWRFNVLTITRLDDNTSWRLHVMTITRLAITRLDDYTSWRLHVMTIGCFFVIFLLTRLSWILIWLCDTWLWYLMFCIK